MNRSLQRLLWLATALLLAAMTGCETLPAAPPSSVAPPDPNEFARLQSAESSCRDELAALMRERDYLTGNLEKQGVSLEEMQAALQRIEKSLQAQVTPPPVLSCPEVDIALADKLIVGRQENVWLEDFQITLSARIDTGAETASLDARNIEEFERDGSPWVRFDIMRPDSGESVTLEREVDRIARILQSSSEKPERRAVISLGIVIGDIRQRAEFTLSDRSHLDYQILIGRNILQDLMVVDVAKMNVAPVKAEYKKKKVAP